MNYVNYVLSSVQIPGYPSVLNHYIFFDPVLGTINWPACANGSYFSETTGTFVYPATANGGLFFPWGYSVENKTLSADLGVFKGQVTLLISPSSIDNTYFTTLKIIYDFNDNEVVNIEKGIVENVLPGNVAFLDAGNPNDKNISHIYTSKSLTGTTYYPTITVLNGNMALNVYNLKLLLLPGTVYDFEDFRLINTSQLSRFDTPEFRSLEVFEIDELDTNYVSNFVLISSYPSPTPSVTPYPSPTPTTTLTPTPTLTPSVTPTLPP